jgi:hypothetical protein
VTDRTESTITLAWKRSTGNVKAYHLYRGRVRVGKTRTTSYTFRRLACGRSYWLAVRASDGAGHRSRKARITASTTVCSPDTQPPSAPTNLATSATGQTGTTLSWTASTDNVGVAGYDVFVNATKVASTTTQTSYTLTGLTCGTSYTLGVEPYDAAGNRSARSTNVASTSACSSGGATASFYSSSSPWNTPIASGAAIDPNSSAMVNALVAAGNSQGFLVTWKSWSVPIYYANSTTPKTSVSLTASWAPANTMAGVPIPSNAAPDPSGDGHMMIVDSSTGCEYDFWKARKNSDETWAADWGNTTYTTNNGIYAYGLSARGSGFALGAGLILPNEMNAGQINHALIFSFPSTKSGGPVASATESDGQTSSTGAIPEGARLQLDPSLDLSTLGLTPWQLAIARALQTYGMILGDTGGGVSLYAQNPQSTSTSYPWPGDKYNYLPTSLLSRMQVLTTGSQFSPTYKLVPTSCATMS